MRKDLCLFRTELRLIHNSCSGLRIPQWMVACCGKIENFLSLCWHSLLLNLQTAAVSVNKPLQEQEIEASLEYYSLSTMF